MQDSIWATTLDAFHSDLASLKPIPAAGSAAAVSARLAVSLVMKVLEIAKSKRRATDAESQLDAILEEARKQSQILARAADQDGEAFAGYLREVRRKASPKALDAAMIQAIEVPLTAARSSVRALGLSKQALSLMPAFVAADLGAAVLLLSGAVRAVLVTVDYNLRQLNESRSDLADERHELEDQARRESEAILIEIGKVCG